MTQGDDLPGHHFSVFLALNKSMEYNTSHKMKFYSNEYNVGERD